MARGRLPAGKAELTGADTINPGRFEGRTPPKRTRPIGEPYLKMTDEQKAAWVELAAEWPWLHSAHRPLLRLACIWIAKMEEGEFGVSATKALSSILSKLGATPVDETKVNHESGDGDDPEDKFFGRPN